MAKKRIEPKVLKGFRDLLPFEAIPRSEMLQKLEQVFRSFGFAPIDTPALEYTEILLGKGSDETDKQMYRFLDNGGRDVALRFDLTIPLARYIATHLNEVGLPFKRYHIAPVWRAEKPQRGRYREFIQCDYDIIGSESALADAEIIAITHEACRALEVNHTIRINNRTVLNGLLEAMDVADHSASVLRAIDKLEKLGVDVVKEELQEEAKLSADQIESLFGFLTLSRSGGSDTPKLIAETRTFLQGKDSALKGLSQLEEILTHLTSLGVPGGNVVVDYSIARGLDYYTGLVFETKFNDAPTIGSIAAGGRYDDLASVYTSKRLPGVGASVGLDRVLAGLAELDRLKKRSSTAQVLVTVADEKSIGAAATIAKDLRASGIATELYPELAKLGNQIKYADRKGIMFVIIAGERELSQNKVSLKQLATGNQEDVELTELIQVVRRYVSP